MKKTILFSSVVLLFSGCNNSSTKDDSKSVAAADTTKATVLIIDTTKLAKGVFFYQCPMDKEVIADKPGSCPKCGMDLEKVEKK